MAAVKKRFLVSAIKTKRFQYLLILTALFFSFLLGLWTARYQTFPYSIFASAYSKIIAKQPAVTAYHAHKKSLFQTLTVQDYDVVLIGDSLTDWGNWHELLPGMSIANRGIAGDSTKLILTRLESIISTRADVAFVMLGINDLRQRRTVEDTFNDYVSIVNTLIEDGLPVVIQSTLYVGESKSHINEHVRQLNARLIGFSQQSEAVSYMDLNKTLAPYGVLSPHFTHDDLHLNGKGYITWSNELTKFLNQPTDNDD